METSARTEASAPPRHLAALLTDIETLPEWNPRAGREAASAIRSIGRWLGRPLDQIPTNPHGLRQHLAGLNPARLGIMPQRLANVKSLLRRALKHAGVGSIRRAAAPELGPDWAHLLHLLEGGHRYLQTSVKPFARYCDARGVVPAAVTDEVADAYRAHREQLTLARHPDHTHQVLCRCWNKARSRIPGWPDVELLVPRRERDTYSLSLEKFPASFREELEQYLRRLSCEDPVDLLDERAPPRPLRPSSIEMKRYRVRAFASALVHKGVPIEQITSLAVLTTPEHFKLGLSYILGRPRQDKANTRSAGVIAHTIRCIAKYYLENIAESDLRTINTLTARLNRRQPGMTDRNRIRLAQLDDEPTLRRFLDMPRQEMERLRRKGVHSRHPAVQFSILLALEILLHAPMRINNVMGLRFGHSLFLPAKGRPGEATISIGRSAVKNRQPLDFVLPEPVTAQIAFYRKHVIPLLDQDSDGYLFPNGRGSAKEPETMSMQLSGLVRKKLGVDFNPHLARHLAAKLFIDERPGDYEGPRRLLGHSSSQTTYETYEGLENKSATRLHAEIVAKKRAYMPVAQRARAGRRFRHEASATPPRSGEPL